MNFLLTNKDGATIMSLVDNLTISLKLLIYVFPFIYPRDKKSDFGFLIFVGENQTEKKQPAKQVQTAAGCLLFIFQVS